MAIEGYLLLIPLIVTGAIALFLYTRGEMAYQRLNRAFGMWVFSICFWYIQLLLETATFSYGIMWHLYHISLLGEWVIPALFLYFVYCFTNEKLTMLRYALIVIPIIFFVMLILLDWMGLNIVISTLRCNMYHETGKSIVYEMPAFLGWLLYFMGYTIHGSVLVIRHLMRTAVIFHRKRLKYLLLQRNFMLAIVSLLVFILGLTLDIIIPIVYGRIFPISSITTVVMVVCIGYLLIRVER